MAPKCDVAERKTADRADMVFELAGLGTFNRPVPRVVNARRHFVRDEAVGRVKQLDRENTNVAKLVEKARGITFGRRAGS